ncbi:MAG: DUF6745 domain-containing protein, partial [Terriglobales bacterium]
MNEKACGLVSFAQVPDLGAKISSADKMKRCRALIDAAPTAVSAQVEAVCKKLKPAALADLLARAASMQHEVCGHAALATLLEPSLSMQYAIAFYKVPAQHHDLIFSTITSLDEKKREHVFQFLTEIEAGGLESAVVQALEWKSMPIFTCMKDAGTNKDPNAVYLKAYLLDLIPATTNAQSKLIALKSLPYVAANKNECYSLIESFLNDPDLNVCGAAALLQSKLTAQNPDVDANLWSPVENRNWSGNEHISIDGFNGTLKRGLLLRLIERACERTPQKQCLELCKREGEFWFSQITSTTAVDRPKVEQGLNRLYEAAGCAPPETVLWVDSPRLGAVVAALYIASVHPGRKPLANGALSPVDTYIDKLVSTIASFPSLYDGCKESWNFGRRGAVPDPEYQRFWNTCGTMLLRAPPSRRRDRWDVIARYDHPLEGECDLAWDILEKHTHALQTVPVFTIGREMQALNWNHIGPFQHRLLDHERLAAVGYRSVLQALGACLHKNDGLEEILLHCGGFIPFEHVAIAIERPSKINLNPQRRLHNMSGRSIEYADGWGVYSVNGMSVKPYVITDPSQITVEEIIREMNLEIRR